ncbi:lysylphosphatidylglycerol synthase transmembrane domain-containing protein [Myxococcaceae bacterium GXIMD 01537]
MAREQSSSTEVSRTLDAARAEEKSSWSKRLSWLPGVLLLVAFVVFVTLRFGDEKRFARLLIDARPQWLLVAVVLQLGTYLCSGAIWRAVLVRSGTRPGLWQLARLSVMKLSFDQVVPTAGVGGSVVVMQGLRKDGAPGGVATAALLVDIISFYVAHAIAVSGALLILWLHADLHRVVLWLATAFTAIAVAIPCFILWLTRHGGWKPPSWTRHIPGMAGLLTAVSDAPPELVRDGRLLAQASAYQLAVFLFDSATFSCMLLAVGHAVAPTEVFAAFMMATTVMTVSIIPGGVGTFEATAVGMLSSLGVPVEPALAATLLLRGYTLWLPLPVGFFLLHRQVRPNHTRRGLPDSHPR